MQVLFIRLHQILKLIQKYINKIPCGMDIHQQNINY